MYYIRENEKLNFIQKVFYKIKIEKDEILLPLEKENKKTSNSKYINKRKLKKKNSNNQKIVDTLKKLQVKEVVVSKKVKEDESILNSIYLNNIDIINGKKLFEYLILDVIEYIITKKNIPKNDCNISILINNICDTSKNNILEICKKYKKVNIITRHLNKFEKIQENILNEYGIMLNIGNNKKKGMVKSNIVINYDFPEEHVNLYNIFEESIIINIHENIKINNKRFNGLNIKDYRINVNDTKLKNIEVYDLKDLYEVQTKSLNNYKEIRKYIKEEKLKISKLICNKTEL